MAQITVTVPNGLAEMVADAYEDDLDTLIQAAVDKRCAQIQAHCGYYEKKTTEEKLKYLEENRPEDYAKVKVELDKVGKEDIKAEKEKE